MPVSVRFGLVLDRLARKERKKKTVASAATNKRQIASDREVGKCVREVSRARRPVVWTYSRYLAMAASSSSSPFFGIRDDGGFFVHQMNLPQPTSQQQLMQQPHPLVLQQPGNQQHQHQHQHQHHQHQPPPTPQQQLLQNQQQVQHQQQEQQSSSTTAPSSSTAGIPAPPPSKKRRNLPGAPNADAEVIALSPKTLLATNRFVCEVCGKGFQREQNLQLHRRGHNLPWKLKQKNPADAARRRVYVCPEPTCAHHDPSRALGDLTGIKKHFCRKHGEKKWKCDKCSKRYAVHSDWKAHSKTCGTREYRCDCGTLFSRRDSFITHRAFCDALAQESGRHPVGLSSLGGHLYGGAAASGTLTGMGLGLSQLMNHQNQAAASALHAGGHEGLLRLGGSPVANQFSSLRSSSNSLLQQRSSTGFLFGGANNIQDYNDSGVSHQSHSLFDTKQQLSSLMQLPNLHGSSIVGGNSQQSPSAAAETGFFNPSGLFSGSTTSNNQHGVQMLNLPLNFNPGSVEQHAGQPVAPTLPRLNLTNSSTGQQTVPTSLYGGTSFHEFDSTLVPAAMSATALLQKAAQMGSTISGGGGGDMQGQSASGLFRGFGSPPNSGSTKPLPSAYSRDMHVTFGGNGDVFLLQPAQLDGMESNHLQDLMNSLVGNGVAPMAAFGPGGNDTFASAGIKAEAKLHHRSLPGAGGGGIGSPDGLTRDFLGVGGSGIIVGSGPVNSQDPIPISEQQRSIRQSHEDDVNVGSLFNESKASATVSRSRSFATENM